MGLMAGPESPPKPAPSSGRRVRASMASARRCSPARERRRRPARRLRQRLDAAYVGGELHDQRTLRGRTYGRDDFGQQAADRPRIRYRRAWCSGRRHSARILPGLPPIPELAPFPHNPRARTRRCWRTRRSSVCAKRGSFVWTKALTPIFCSPIGVDHAGARFPQPRGRIAFDRLA